MHTTAAAPTPAPTPARVTVRAQVPVRGRFAGRALLDFLAYHLVPGVEVAGTDRYARTVDLPHGPGTVEVVFAGPDLDDVTAVLALADPRDEAAALAGVRRLLDADRDPAEAVAALSVDPVLGPLMGRTPGLRVPGQVDGAETAIRTVIGQQVSVTGARTVTGRIVAAHGRRIETGIPGLTHLFPSPDVLAGLDAETLPMPRARGRALVALASALAAGAVDLDRPVMTDAERGDVRRTLLALPGIGPWTADYVAMRALGDPDVFLPTDIGVRNALRGLGQDPAAVLARTDDWSPWRSWALMHLWSTLMPASFGDL